MNLDFARGFALACLLILVVGLLVMWMENNTSRQEPVPCLYQDKTGTTREATAWVEKAPR